jgi:hypothetical protein
MRELEEISAYSNKPSREYHITGNYMLAAHAELYKMAKQQFHVARAKVCFIFWF